MSNGIKAEFMNDCLGLQYKAFIQSAEMFLREMSTGEIDKILTIRMPQVEKDVFAKYCTIIDVLYPNEKEVMSIYCIGSSFIKIIT